MINDPITLAKAYAEYLNEFPEQLRIVDTSRYLPSSLFGYREDENFRAERAIEEMGVQLATDAFKRGLGVLVLTAPLYRIQGYLGTRHEYDSPPPPDPPFVNVAPTSGQIPDRAVVEVHLAAIVFPIKIQEV